MKRFLIAILVLVVLGAAIELVLLQRQQELAKTPRKPPTAMQAADLQAASDEHAGPPVTTPATAPSADAAARRSEEELDSKPIELRVRVVDESDSPIAGASIWLIRAQAYEFPSKREIDSVKLCDELCEARGESDAMGVFAWPELAPALRLIVARSSGHTTGFAWSEMGGASPLVASIHMKRGDGLRGIVHDRDGAPASGAFVNTMPRARPGLESDSYESFRRFLLGSGQHTGADGRFLFDSLSDEIAELHCSLPGRTSIYIDWVAPMGQEVDLKFVDSVAVNGTVCDEAGAPIAGANIYVSTPGIMPLIDTEPVHSDEHGEFLVENVPPGRVEVKVDKRGFAIYKQPFTVKNGSETFDVTLKPESDCTGIVVDPSGKPIEGAKVRVVDAKQFVMCGHMDSEADGSWYMYWVPSEGPIDVYVERDGYMPARLRGLSAPPKQLRIVLMPACRLRGRVIDADGNPVTRFAFKETARGEPHGWEYANRIDEAWHAAVSPDGHFEIANAMSGPLEVSVRASGFRPKTVSDILVGPGEAGGPIDIQLVPSSEVQGTVVDSTNHPIVGANIEIAESTFDGRPALTLEPFGTPTGADGRFQLDTVPDGPFTIVIRRGEYRAVFADVRAGDFPRTFVLEPPGTIVGSVSGSWARPETCVRIRVALDGTWIGRVVRPESDGRFHVEDLAPGDYRIELVDDWSEQERLRDGRVSSFVTVRPNETSMVVLDASGSGVIEGRVVTLGTGLTGHQLSLRAFEAGASGPFVAESFVDGNGLFRFDHLHAGNYRIRVGSYERGIALAVDQEVTVTDNSTTGPIEIVLATGGLSGRVLRPGGGPADAHVALVDTQTGREVTSVRTDGDGSYRLLSAPDGNYFVLASAAASADNVAGPVSFPSDPSDAPLEQQLEKESRLLARVRDDVGQPIAGASIDLDLSTLRASFRHKSLVSDSSGEAEFARLPAGSLSASASHAGYVSSDVMVMGLAVDQRRTVDLVLARCGTLDVSAKDLRGHLLAGVEITLSLGEIDPRGERTRRGRTNRRGTYRFTSLLPGRWQVSGESTNQTTVDVPPGASVSTELVGQR